MATNVEEGFVYLSSAMWKGVSPPSQKVGYKIDTSSSPSKVTYDPPSTNALTKKIKWQRPAAPVSTINPSTSEVADMSDNDRKTDGDVARAAITKTTTTASSSSSQPSKAKQQAKRSSTKRAPAKSKKTHASTNTLHGNDPYNLPLSPISSSRQKNNAPLVKADTMHPKSGNASASSPAKIMKSVQPDKKKRGNQKRVPKRSILDPPETPDTEQINPPVESFSKLLEVPQSTTVHTSATKPFLSSVVKPMKREPRQRKERFPIVITSDSGASSDYDGSCNGKTTSMLQHSRWPLITTSPHPQRRMSHLLPVELEEEAETFNTKSRQARTNTKPNRNLPKRGRAKAAPHTQNVENYKKRELSPTTTVEDIREGKKTKLEPPQKPDHDVIMEHPQPVKVRENPKVLRTAVVSDPFLENKDDSSTCLTEFTAKLLNTASQPESVEPVRFQAESTAIPTGLFLRRNDSTQEQVEPSGIAREMMESLETAAPPKTGSRTRSLHKRSGTESAKDTWLNQADPYKATSQIMSYVCTTILRFLKSKEAAIEDVAKEYLQRGEVVIKRIKTLHDSERVDVCRKFELCQLGSLHIFDEARRDIRVISNKLERIDVSHSVKNMLMDDTASRLRELQAKIM